MTCASLNSWAFENGLVISPPPRIYPCGKRSSQMKYVLVLFCFFLSFWLTVFSQLYCGRHGNECRCFLRGGILVFLLQWMTGREGERERRAMLSFHLCLWRLAFVSTFGQAKSKMEFEAKHLRAFKMVLLICTLIDLYITIHVEQTGHSSCLRRTEALLGSFSQTWASKILSVVPTHIFS